ncbi:MAG: D-sedoheptulose 7-phosphate isomerase [Elusimicrobia bacterium]|nr:D-sedoheptulose 7-phosphate isomerase [Elusimicrobiota bacterium]
MDTRQIIESLIQDSIEAKQKMLSEDQLNYIQAIANKIVEAYNKGKKLIVMGNGGSAADALHFAAEMVCRFEKNRNALPAIALSENISTITAIGNDFGYDQVFSRQIEAFAAKGDVVVAITTSGNSPNVVKALEAARKMGIFSIGFTGADGGKIKTMSDMCYCAPSKVTGRVQECHILAIHIICKLIEDKVFAY